MMNGETPQYFLILANQNQYDALRYIFKGDDWQRCVQRLGREDVDHLNTWRNGSSGTQQNGLQGTTYTHIDPLALYRNVTPLPDHSDRPAASHELSTDGNRCCESNTIVSVSRQDIAAQGNSSQGQPAATHSDMSSEKSSTPEKCCSTVITDAVNIINNENTASTTFSATVAKSNFVDIFSFLEKYLNITKLSMQESETLNPELDRLFNNYMQVTRLFCQTVNNINAQKEEDDKKAKEASQVCEESKNIPFNCCKRTVQDHASSMETRSKLAKYIAQKTTPSKSKLKQKKTAIKTEQKTELTQLIGESGKSPEAYSLDKSCDGSDTKCEDSVSESSADEDTLSASGEETVNNSKTKAVKIRTRKLGMDEQTNFQCPYCPSNYINVRTMRRHIFQKHPENAPMFTCDVCLVQFGTRDKLRKHGRETGHMGIKPETFQCELCGKCLKRYDSYLKHLDRIHVNKYQYPCDECGRMFNALDTVKAHKRRIHSSNPAPCDICGKMFKHRLDMLCHRKRHDEMRRNYRCNHCGKGFFNLQALKIHVRSHTGEKPYKCDYCTYACTCRANLTKHLKIHKKTGTLGQPVSSEVNMTEAWDPSQSLHYQTLSCQVMKDVHC